MHHAPDALGDAVHGRLVDLEAVHPCDQLGDTAGLGGTSRSSRGGQRLVGDWQAVVIDDITGSSSV